MNRTLLILSGALLLSGIAMFYLYAEAFIRDETGGQRVLVVIAAADIPFGEPIRPEWLTTTELPQSYVEERHLRASDLRRLVGLPLAQSVRAGEAILRTDLSSLSAQQRTLSAEIPPGKRAVSIHARPESSFAGLLRPGDRVDVLLTVSRARERGSGRTVVLAQNLLVLSVGRTVTRGWDDARNQPRDDPSMQVSLEVGLEEAQRLTHARGRGSLRLLLRNPNDVGLVAPPPQVAEADLESAQRRADWLRRFALVERPELAAEPPTEASATP